MQRGVLAAVTLALLSVAAPARGYLVEVTTSVAVGEADDRAAIKNAVQNAVDDVLRDAIAFKPTLVVLTRALMIGERLYLRILIADQDGEQTAKDLVAPQPDEDDASPSSRIEL